MSARRVVVLDVVGLTPKHLRMERDAPHLHRLALSGQCHLLKPVFPAVTLPVQASLLTGVYPERHGVVSNGFYFPETYHVAFWEQAARLVRAERFWEKLKRRRADLTTALLFFQNSLYAPCEIVITPRPLHTHDGMIQWCYSKPVGLYEELCRRIGEFNLMHFWGPMVSIESTRWIAKAALEVLDRLRPDLLFVYLPHLDYGSQKLGPEDPRLLGELSQVDAEVGRILDGLGALGLDHETALVVLSEYAFSSVVGDVPLNRMLREAGFLKVRTIQGREYLDLERSEAFAMVDHQVAHIYTKPGVEKQVRAVLEKTDHVDFVLDREEQKEFRVAHESSGDFIVVSARDHWFSYYWWDDSSKEPDFAGHVDIHRKPGYDPLEMFFDAKAQKISQDTGLIRGSHGYIPLDSSDLVPLVIQGPSPGMTLEGESLSITDVPRIIEGLLGL